VRTGRKGDGNFEKRRWELVEKEVGTGRKEVGTGRKGGENWEKMGWELGEKEVGTGRKEGGNW